MEDLRTAAGASPPATTPSALALAIRTTLAEARGPAFEARGAWTSWPEAAEAVNALRAAFDALGLPEAARVGFVARNRLGPSCALIAILADDRCAVPLNPFQSDAALAADVAQLDLAALVGLREDLTPALLDADRTAAVIALQPDLDAPVAVVRRPGFAGRTSADTAIVLGTSGTTGAPKRIPLRRDSWYATLTASGPRNDGSVAIQYSPLAHIAGALTVSGAAARGGSVALLEKFTVEGWLDAVRRHRPATASLPPTMMRMVMDADPP
ncbi:MAG: hypothetical protein JWQ97_1631, partial [Phenylobacterium sp.]|nr:hypothetical protein [Phenylobacterium sp.]